MDSNTIITVTTIVIGFLGLIVKSYFDERNAEMKRRWDIEDRQRIADALTKHNDVVTAGMAEAKAATQTLVVGMADNTALTKVAAQKADVAAQKADDAYQEANQVNQKIASLGSPGAPAYTPPSDHR